MKTEALKLADELDKLHQYVPSEAPAMIRRLVEELDCANDYIKQYQLEKQGEPVAWWNGKSKFCSPRDKSWDAKTGGILSFGCNIPLYTTPQTKPLSDEEIEALEKQCTSLPPKPWKGVPIGQFDYKQFARAIEERHGIK